MFHARIPGYALPQIITRCGEHVALDQMPFEFEYDPAAKCALCGYLVLERAMVDRDDAGDPVGDDLRGSNGCDLVEAIP